MCVAVPMLLRRIEGQMGVAELDGVEREVALHFLEDPAVGDYVLIHAGFALRKIDREEAEETLELLRRLVREPPPGPG
jgi:hydrogenase expression/formation protein HypC